MVGCGDLLTLHALYTKDTQVFDPSIEGKWENADNSMVVTRMGDLYQVLLQGKPAHGEPTKFELHLLDIQGVRFADLEAADQIGHMILRVRRAGGQLQDEDIFRDDGYSGASLRRPGLDRLRDKAALAVFDRIYVTDPDRLARNFVHQVLLIEELQKHQDVW